MEVQGTGLGLGRFDLYADGLVEPRFCFFSEFSLVRQFAGVLRLKVMAGVAFQPSSEEPSLQLPLWV